MAGKGDTPRKVDCKRYGANHDAINWPSRSVKRSGGVVAEIKRVIDEQCKGVE